MVSVLDCTENMDDITHLFAQFSKPSYNNESFLSPTVPWDIKFECQETSQFQSAILAMLDKKNWPSYFLFCC